MKRRVLRSLALVGLAIATMAGGAPVAHAQAPAAPAAPAVPPPAPRPLLAETMPIGGDMAQYIRFYNQLLGLQSRNDDPRLHLEWLIGSEFLNDMYASSGDYRGIHFVTPPSPVVMAGQEMQIEPIQWRNPKGKPLNPRPQDAGATRIIFKTWDIDRLVGYLKTGGGKVVTTGGVPVAVAGPDGAGRAIVFDDGTGSFVELFQPDALPKFPERTAAALQSFIYASDTTISVSDIERSAKFFHDVFGLEAKIDPAFHSDPKRLQVLGMRGGEYREAAVAWPERTPQLNLVQFKAPDQKTLTPLVGDPNATLMRIFVRDMEPIVAALKSFPDAKIMNTSGAPIKRGATTWLIVKVPGASTYLQLIAVPTGRVG